MMANIKMEKICVVFASDNNYAQHAAVAMVSILMNAAVPERLSFYLLDDNVAEPVKEKMRQSIERYGAELHFIAVDAEAFCHFFVSGQLSRTAYFRLEMANLLPDDVDRAIYLDCDLLVWEDIGILWKYDMKGKPLAAVPDLGIMASSKDWGRKQQSLGMERTDLYFNSGVLMVDLAQWRSKGYGGQVEQVAMEHDYQHHDQDALNKVFYRNWEPLPLRWNVIPPVWQLFLKILCRARYRKAAMEARTHIAILHYAGGYKPWEYEEYPAFNEGYYRCLEKSRFCDAKMPQFDARRKHRSIHRQLRRIALANFWQKIGL